jgi:crotonyl-CoA reductase
MNLSAAPSGPYPGVGTSIPDEYTAAHVQVEDVGMFAGAEDKDVRKSIRVGTVPMPEIAPDEVLVAVMASSINYNTVWSAMFEPVPTFQFLRQLGDQGHWERRHDRPYHVLGSDGAGIVVHVGEGVRRWQVGDHVVVSCVQADDQEPATQADGMLGEQQRVWGYETNFGGLAEYAVVGDRGARMKQGDVVLIWGAAGGLGAHAIQFVNNGGGVSVGVVGSDRKAEVASVLGCDVVIDRREVGIGDDDGHDPAKVLAAGKRLGKMIRKETGEDPHIVFDHVGQATFGISMFVARRGGTVITCGSSTGYQHQYDNRYLWMKLKRLIGSHAANLHEQWESNRLVELGRIVPVLSEVYPLADVAEAARLVQNNGHVGKVGVLCLASRPGLGVTDPLARNRIGERQLTPLAGG